MIEVLSSAVVVPAWVLLLALSAVAACAWAVASMWLRLIGAEAIAGDVERVEIANRQARRELREVEQALGHVREAMAGRCGCGYLAHVHGAIGRMADIRISLRPGGHDGRDGRKPL